MYPFIAIASLWPGMVAHDRVLSMGQIELFDIKCVQTNEFFKLNCLK